MEIIQEKIGEEPPEDEQERIVEYCIVCGKRLTKTVKAICSPFGLMCMKHFNAWRKGHYRRMLREHEYFRTAVELGEELLKNDEMRAETIVGPFKLVVWRETKKLAATQGWWCELQRMRKR